MRARTSRSLSAALVLAVLGCPPQRVEPEVVGGCERPDAVFTSNGIDISTAESKFGQVVVGEIKVKNDPQVLNLLSTAASDDRMRNYLRCLSITRDKYTPEQAAYFDQLYAFAATKPTADQFQAWQASNPFPGKKP